MSSNSDTDSESLLTSFKDVTKSCNWCKQYKPLYGRKPYCKECATKMYRECTRCHLPYTEEKSFTENDKRCNSCQKKYLKEKERRENRKNAPLSDNEFNSEVVKKQHVGTLTTAPVVKHLPKISIVQIPKKRAFENETTSVIDFFNSLPEDSQKKPKLMIFF